jgi:DNA-binding Xre family transcriptional regulator
MSYDTLRNSKGNIDMSIKYYKLLDLMQRRSIGKTELANMAKFSSATLAKLSSHKPVNMAVINSICQALQCQPGDIMEYIED